MTHSIQHYRRELDAVKRQLSSAYEREAAYQNKIRQLTAERIVKPVEKTAEIDRAERLRDLFQHNWVTRITDWDTLTDDIVEVCSAAINEYEAVAETADLTAKVEKALHELADMAKRYDESDVSSDVKELMAILG